MLSIIVPVYHSKNILPVLCKRISDLQLSFPSLEMIMIDDGSKDGSFETIKELSKQYSFIRGFRLSRNFGHQNAVRKALEFTRGDLVAIIDDDLQDPPELLIDFAAKIKEGYDVVYGVRKQRKGSVFKVFSYFLFYRLLKILSDIDIPLDTGDFCMMRSWVAEEMSQMRERRPFLRGLRSWCGGNQIGIEYNRGGRLEGESGYTLKKLFQIAFDGIFSFSFIPLRLITFLGVLGILFSCFYAVYILGRYMVVGVEEKGFISLAFLIMFFGSLNLLSLGMMGEYLSRLYSEQKRRPFAIVVEEVSS